MYSKIIRKNSLIYLDCIPKGATFAPAFQEKKALKNWLSEKAESHLKKRTKNFRKSLDNTEKSSYLCSPIRKENRRVLLSYILSLSHREPEKLSKKKNWKKTSEKVWWLKIKPLPLHPLLKRKQQVLWNIDKQYK